MASTTEHTKSKENFSDDITIKMEKEFIDRYYAGNGRSMKILFKLYKGYYGKLLLSSLFFIIKYSPALVLPIIIANVVNLAVVCPDDFSYQMFLNIGIIVVLMVLNVPFNWLYVKFYSIAMRNVEAGLRGALVRKLQQLSISFYKEMESGRIQSKLMRDVESIYTFSTQIFIGLLSISVNIIIALSVVVTKNFIVFLFFILCIPVAAIIASLFRKKIRFSNREFRQEMEATSARVMDMVDMIPVTRAHALEHEEIRNVTSQINLIALKGYRLDILQSIFGSVNWVVVQLFQIVCLVFTAFLAYHKKISVGEITLYQAYFSSLVGQVSALINLIPTIAKGTESIASIGEVLIADDIENNRDKKKLTNLKGEYEFKDVCFSYDESRPVLNHFNLKVKQGETIAFVGESGAGKSTVLNMVIGFNLADSGQVMLDGEDIKNIDLRSYRKNIAVVPQTSILFSGSIRDNITYGVKSFTEAQLQQIIKASCLESVINNLPEGLDTKIGENGAKLSGGQRQRISIARALIRDPKVIVLDEATSALDSVSEKEIQIALNNLTDSRTTFIVAHRLSTIKDADKIAVMANGICVEYGTYDELMSVKGEFYKLKQLQL